MISQSETEEKAKECAWTADVQKILDNLDPNNPIGLDIPRLISYDAPGEIPLGVNTKETLRLTRDFMKRVERLLEFKRKQLARATKSMINTQNSAGTNMNPQILKTIIDSISSGVEKLDSCVRALNHALIELRYADAVLGESLGIYTMPGLSSERDGM